MERMNADTWDVQVRLLHDHYPGEVHEFPSGLSYWKAYGESLSGRVAMEVLDADTSQEAIEEALREFEGKVHALTVDDASVDLSGYNMEEYE